MARAHRRRTRVDGNHKEVIDGLRRLKGVMVRSTASLGHGFPDIVVGYREMNFLFEIKDPQKPPSKRRLEGDELDFYTSWPGQVAIALTVDDVKRIIGYGEQG